MEPTGNWQTEPNGKWQTEPTDNGQTKPTGNWQTEETDRLNQLAVVEGQNNFSFQIVSD